MSAAHITGTLTAAEATVAIDARGMRGVALQLTGTFVGTVTFEASVDMATWVALNVTPSASGIDVSTATAPGAWRKDIAGYQGVRARMSAYTSGTAIVHCGGN